jgi:hypothetical protein
MNRVLAKDRESSDDVAIAAFSVYHRAIGRARRQYLVNTEIANARSRACYQI